MRARAGTRPVRMPCPIRLRNRLRRTPTPSPSALPVTSEPGSAGFRPRHSVKEPPGRFASRPSGPLAIRGARRTPSTRRMTSKTRWPSRPQAPYGWAISLAACTRTRISSTRGTSRRTWRGNRPVRGGLVEKVPSTQENHRHSGACRNPGFRLWFLFSDWFPSMAGI